MADEERITALRQALIAYRDAYYPEEIGFGYKLGSKGNSWTGDLGDLAQKVIEEDDKYASFN